MFKISYGANNGNADNRTVNRNATLRAPTLMVSDQVPPGWYTVTMERTDVPYLHWIKCNMPSTVKSGKDVVVYEPPLTDPQIPPPYPMHFVVTLWRQSTGRLSPAPRGPSNRTRYNLDRFARKNGLVRMAQVGFFVK